MHENESSPDTDRTAAAAARWPAALLEALAADARVVGAADLSDAGCEGGNCRFSRKLLVVTTWDGGASLPAELPRLGGLATGGAGAASLAEGDLWRGLTAGLEPVEIQLVRIGDLKPSAAGESAVPVLDRKDLLGQWVRWSRGRDRSKERPPERPRDAFLLDAADAVRSFERFVPGTVHLTTEGPQPIRPLLAPKLRELRAQLDAGASAEALLAGRIDAVAARVPQPGAGVRIVADDVLPPEAARERFLAIADAEGFRGDRPLFDAALARLRELSRREPTFDEGFLVPTFDAVEARWRFGEGIGGCKVPLIPAVHVGVGVTPADHLEFWAAPAVRMPPATVACVADSGARVIVERTAGRDALFGALLAEVERAWDELPDLLRAARRAGRTPAPDPEGVLAPLHLPRTFREAAKSVLPQGGGGGSRLGVAYALIRVGTGEDPLIARKLGLAAGRVLAATPPGPPGADDDCATI